MRREFGGKNPNKTKTDSRQVQNDSKSARFEQFFFPQPPTLRRMFATQAVIIFVFELNTSMGNISLRTATSIQISSGARLSYKSHGQTCGALPQVQSVNI